MTISFVTVSHILLFATFSYIRIISDCRIHVTVLYIPIYSLTVLNICSQAEEGRAAEALRADSLYIRLFATVSYIRIIRDCLTHVTGLYIQTCCLTVLYIQTFKQVKEYVLYVGRRRRGVRPRRCARMPSRPRSLP
jgi:hypothetical protein